MNTINIVMQKDIREISKGVLYLKIDLTIDGIDPISNTDDIDICDLINSVHEDGIYFIFTCCCGVAGCAGYFDGIKVTTIGEKTFWFDQDSNKEYVFLTNDLRLKIKKIYNELVEIKDKAEASKLRLEIFPSWNIDYLIKAIKPCC